MRFKYLFNVLLGLCIGISTPIAHAEQIPELWYGHWQGRFSYTSADNTVKTGQMDLTITPIAGSSSLSWIIQYEGERPRPYQMNLVDEAKGHYVLDEKNGIFIDHIFSKHVLFDQFYINGKVLTTQTMLQDDVLVSSGTMFSTVEMRLSGGGALPEVKAFRFLGTQRSDLRKVSDPK